MVPLSSAHQDEGLVRDEGLVEMRVFARPRLVSTLRAAVSDLAATADFDLDTISDLRMAVDEACTSLIRLTSENSVLVCTFAVSKNKMEVTVKTCAQPPSGTVNIHGFGWCVLEALTDEAQFESDINGEAGRIAIRFTKHAVTG